MLKSLTFRCANPVDYLRIGGWVNRVNYSTLRSLQDTQGDNASGHVDFIPETIRRYYTWLSTVKILELPLLNKFCTQYPQYLLQEPLRELKERL